MPADPQASDAVAVLDTAGAGGRVLSGGSIRVVAYAAGSALSVVSISLVARHLGARGFDEYATVMSMSAIALTVTDFGLATLGVREYVALHGAERQHVMRVLIALRLVLMLAGTLGMLVFASLAGFSREVWIGTLLAGLGLVTQAVPATYVIPLHATLRLGWVGAIDFVRQATLTGVLVALTLAGAGVAPLLGAAVPAGLASLILAAWVARGLAPLTPTFDWRRMRMLLVVSTSFAVATSIGTIYAYIAQIVTHLSTTDYESGLFALSFRIFAVIVATAQIAVSSAYPVLVRAAQQDHHRFAAVGTRAYQGVFSLGVLACLALAIGAPTVVATLGGSEYGDAVDVARVHAAAIPGSFLVAAGAYVLLALHRYKALLRINLSVLATSVVLTAVMASRWDAIGGAAAMVITEYALALALYIAIRRSGHNVGLPLRTVMAGAVGVCAAVGVAMLLAPYATSTVENVATTVAGVTAAVVAVVAAGGIPPEVRAKVRSRFGRGVR